MNVVAAGVHHTLANGCEWQACLLGDGQCVDVATDRDRRRFPVGPLDAGDDAGFCDASRVGDAKGMQRPLEARRGLLGQGSFLLVTSVANRTSPVSRGKWVLENLLGVPPPLPPPNVPAIDESPEAAKASSLRQKMEVHRGNPACASCHRIMDPIGFALENFDLVGAWRETDNGSPIDSTGQLADGTPLKNAADLREALLSRSDAFIETVTEKLMTFATGRPVSHTDMPDVRAIAHRTTAAGNRFSAMLMGVIESDQFHKRVKAN
jgi:hypothetical protein